MVKVEAVQIGDSPFAPLFTILAGPDSQAKQLGENKKEWADRHFKRYEFWKGLLEKSRERTKLFSAISPGRANWIGTGAGKSGVFFAYWISRDSSGCDFYIDYDKDTGEKNKEIFDALHTQKESIEKDFGGPLEWERLDGKRASRIRKDFPGKGLSTPDTWQDLQDEMIDAMIRLDRTLRSRLAKIKA